jgi:hypothetical protein
VQLITHRPILGSPATRTRHGDADIDQVPARQVISALRAVSDQCPPRSWCRERRRPAPQGIAEEAQVAGLEVAASDDGIESTDRFAVDRVLERGIDRVRDREQADRGVLARLEDAAVGPDDGQAARHGSPSDGSRTGSPSRDPWGGSRTSESSGGDWSIESSSLGRCPLPAVRTDAISRRRGEREDRLGSPAAAWHELDDVGIDLGWPP